VKYSLSLVTAPTTECVTLESLKRHLRLETTERGEDADLRNLLRAAERYIQRGYGRQTCTATWRLSMDQFCYTSDQQSGLTYIPIPLPPLASSTSITYVDPDGVSTTWASSNYTVDTYAEPGRVLPVYGQTWPSVRVQANSVQIQFVAGQASTDVNQATRHAVKMLAGHWHENREALLTGTITKEVELGMAALLDAEWHGSYR
jgi:uncharacterized phiE125 gp8 family phage protein